MFPFIHTNTKQSAVDAISGMGLMTLPAWVQGLDGWLQTFCLVTGAILGAVGIYRLIFRNNRGDQ